MMPGRRDDAGSPHAATGRRRRRAAGSRACREGGGRRAPAPAGSRAVYCRPGARVPCGPSGYRPGASVTTAITVTVLPAQCVDYTVIAMILSVSMRLHCTDSISNCSLYSHGNRDDCREPTVLRLPTAPAGPGRIRRGGVYHQSGSRLRVSQWHPGDQKYMLAALILRAGPAGPAWCRGGGRVAGST